MRVGNDMHSVKVKQFGRDLPDDFLLLKRGAWTEENNFLLFDFMLR